MSELIDREALRKKLLSWDEIDPYEFVEMVYHAIDSAPTIAASPWHRVEDELPKENGAYVVWWNYKGASYWFRGIFFDGRWLFEDGTPKPDYWMPIEPPKEDA